MSKPFTGPRVATTREQLTGKTDPAKGPTWQKGKRLSTRSKEKNIEVARKGGLAVLKRYGPNYFREIGKKGGRAVVEKYGENHMSEIGTSGGMKAQERGRA